MKRNFLIIGFLSSILLNATAQGDAALTKNDLEWNEFYRLQWEDFKGTPGESAAGDAGTSVQIKAKPYMVKNEVKYDVFVLFNRDKSWSRDKSPQLLAHEQLHFDLGEVYARKIRKLITDYKKKGVNDVKAYNNVISQLLQESNEADRQYDIETLHGALSDKQAAWSKKIKGELADLKAYKKTKKVITAR
jgi:hypothetical protein